MSLAPSRAVNSAIAHAMLCLFATSRIRPFLPSRSIPSIFSLSFFFVRWYSTARDSGTDFDLNRPRDALFVRDFQDQAILAFKKHTVDFLLVVFFCPLVQYRAR